VCPVDCFYEGLNTLVINPDECIDCGVCEPECPAGAIHADITDKFSQEYIDDWVNANRMWSEKWPVITEAREPLPDADKLNPERGYDGPNKRKDFSPKAGPGD